MNEKEATIGPPFVKKHSWIFTNGPYPASFCLFSSFQTNITILQQYVKNVHPVYSIAIRSHDLQNMSLLP